MTGESLSAVRYLLALALVALSSPAASAAGTVVSAFYYPWYGTTLRDGSYVHWSQYGHDPPDDIASTYYPAGGIYSSDDARVLATQMREIRSARIGEVAVSWWGRGSREDLRLPAVAAAAATDGIAVAVHIEPYDGRTPSSVAADIDYLSTLGIRRFYVYQPVDFSAEEWAAVIGTLERGVQLFAQTDLVGFAAAGRFDGVYTYDIVSQGGETFARLCSEAHAHGLLCAPSVGPGYDARRGAGDGRVKPRRNGATYDAMWRAAIRSHADIVTITSFNEWQEGTQIEPAVHRTLEQNSYLGYEGSWHLFGRSSQTAYLDRTAYWAARFAAERSAASNGQRRAGNGT
jgi:hypothetical protein